MLLRNDKQPITGSVERGTRSPHGLKELAYMKRKSAGNSCASVKRKPTPLGAKFGTVIISRSMRLSYGLFENTVISVLLVK